jgi:hypothetical protein
VRIPVVSPRSGNHRVECPLGTIYGLTSKGGAKKPEATTARAVRAWAEAGGFQDGWIMHMHRRFRPRFCDVIDSVLAHLLTPVRDPSDAFVSYYYWSQQRTSKNQDKAQSRPRQSMVGRTLDDPEVFAYLADVTQAFGHHIASTHA